MVAILSTEWFRATGLAVCLLLLAAAQVAAQATVPGPIRPGPGTIPDRQDTITVVYPNGDEVFFVGEIHEIEWDWYGLIETVKIQYSIDGGETWLLITGSTWNDGLFWWTVPDTPSEECRIRVSDATSYDVRDDSDGDFFIYENCFVGAALTRQSRN